SLFEGIGGGGWDVVRGWGRSRDRRGQEICAESPSVNFREENRSRLVERHRADDHVFSSSAERPLLVRGLDGIAAVGSESDEQQLRRPSIWERAGIERR